MDHNKTIEEVEYMEYTGDIKINQIFEDEEELV